MLQKRVIPCLLLKENLLVKTIGFREPRHIGEPIYAIKIFNDYEVDELIIVDIMASRLSPGKNDRAIPLNLISKISDESCMPITYGGGIRSLQDISSLFRAGVEKVCINTQAIEDPEFIRLAATEYGSQSVVVSLDVKTHGDGTKEIYSHGGMRGTGMDPLRCARLMEEMGAGEVLLNSIDRDGMMQGYDLELIKSIGAALTIPVIALGGAGSYEDLSRVLDEGGASAAAAGSMFVYFGRKKAVLINYPSREEIEEILSS